ncbi:hypothetical protein [Rhodopila sp.]|uniref:hypothetical protein n=1 Tax=Rhodopila sp. TaxID=2480087 RepID=UPI003D0DA9D3
MLGYIAVTHQSTTEAAAQAGRRDSRLRTRVRSSATWIIPPRCDDRGGCWFGWWTEVIQFAATLTFANLPHSISTRGYSARQSSPRNVRDRVAAIVMFPNPCRFVCQLWQQAHQVAAQQITYETRIATIVLVEAPAEEFI